MGKLSKKFDVQNPQPLRTKIVLKFVRDGPPIGNSLEVIVRLIVQAAISQFIRHTPRMHTVTLYHPHHFPAEISGHCVWLYFRSPLSFRDVEEMLARRGVVLTYETVREWCLKFGQKICQRLATEISTAWRPVAP